jgi:hypothetical protein
MKMIKEIVEMIGDELQGAEEYARNAVLLRETNPSLAKTYYDISLDEMKHVNMLHDEAKKVIDDYRKEKGQQPESMMAVYEYLHSRHIEEANEVKGYQTQYKERVYG